MPEHCPGCRGWTPGFQSECPGAEPRAALSAHPGDPAPEPLTVVRGPTLLRQYVPRLHWRDRLGVLLGRKVLLTVDVSGEQP